MNADRLIRIGFLLVMGGLLVQIGAAFFWRPATFLVSAGIGVPLVLAGALTVWRGVRRAARAARSPGQGQGS